MKILHRPCHVCGSMKRRVLFKQHFSGLSSGSFLHEYDVCVCEECGLGFADRLPPQEDFDRYYAEMTKWDYLDTGGVESDQHAARFEAVGTLVSELEVPKDSPVLDIGCSTGGMLAALKRRGFTELLGMDPSLCCAELAQKNYEIDVFTGAVGTLNQLPTHFGLVLLSGVLEHFAEPNPALADIRHRLQDGGLFYVCVPDASRFPAYFDAPYQHFSIEHVLFFSPDSLVNLLRRSGFEPVKIVLNDYPYTLSSNHPVIEAVFRKCKPSGWTRDESTEPALLEYIRISEKVEEKVAAQIEALIHSQEPVFVWGVGTQTQRLMTARRLQDANIIGFVDSNPHYQGKQLMGRPIIAPADLAGHKETIVIGSMIFRREIVEQIRGSLRLDNPLIPLGAE